MKKKHVEINDFADLQEWQEKLGLSYAAPLTEICTAILNHFAQNNHEHIKIDLNELVVPDAFKRNACVWARQIKKQSILPHIVTHKAGALIGIQATAESKPVNWMKSLKERLLTQSIIIFPNENVPEAYIKNAYTIKHRLKKQGIHINVHPSAKQLTIVKSHANIS